MKRLLSHRIRPIAQKTARAVMALALLSLATALSVRPAAAQGFAILHSFEDRPDGSSPFSSLVAGRAGDLYGTTYLGGTYGAGTVFKLAKTGEEVVLYSFTGGRDGGFPLAGLVRGKNGALYGTTRGGGKIGYGTVFKFQGGKQTVLHSFSVEPDGAQPGGALILDSSGNLYGTTITGGMFASGTIFKIKNHVETILYNFCSQGDCVDGAAPTAGLIRDASGNLYGTTSSGGPSGNGTVFKLDTNNVETVLYAFRGKGDGRAPQASLVMDAEGNLYGTTLFGGHLRCDSRLGCGTVFKVDTTGTETVLHAFNGGKDGAGPIGSLLLDAANNLYGTAQRNGVSGYGTVFRLTGGVFTVLHSFSNNDGAFPQSGLFQDTAGNLIGTTELGGDLNCNGGEGCGTVFKVVPEFAIAKARQRVGRGR